MSEDKTFIGWSISQKASERLFDLFVIAQNELRNCTLKGMYDHVLLAFDSLEQCYFMFESYLSEKEKIEAEIIYKRVSLSKTEFASGTRAFKHDNLFGFKDEVSEFLRHLNQKAVDKKLFAPLGHEVNVKDTIRRGLLQQ